MNIDSQDFFDTKNILLNRLLRLSTILSFMGLSISLIRYFEHGWMNIMSVHLGITGTLALMCMNNKRISYNVKGVVLVSLFYITGFLAVTAPSTRGNGLLFLLSCSVLSSILFGKKGSIYSVSICILSLLILTVLSLFDISPFHSLYACITNSSWHASIAAFIICVSTVSYGINFIYSHLQNSVNNLTNNNQQLLKANNELDNFVYRVSHDLRAPLLSIKGLIELHEAEENSPQSTVYLDLEKKSIHKLDDFIINIIEYSKNSRTRLNFKVLNFKNVITEIISPLAINHPKVDHKTFINIDRPLYSDPFRVHVILNNLLSNAFRFSESFSETPIVHVHLEEKNHIFLIRVSDNGPGISPEHQAKIFDIFYRGTDTNHGSGIGLYLAQEATEKLGGKIYFKSTPSKGATFFVELPNKMNMSEQKTRMNA